MHTIHGGRCKNTTAYSTLPPYFLEDIVQDFYLTLVRTTIWLRLFNSGEKHLFEGHHHSGANKLPFQG
eukprot:12916609-Prorocentrum_lima.AAC.1